MGLSQPVSAGMQVWCVADEDMGVIGDSFWAYGACVRCTSNAARRCPGPRARLIMTFIAASQTGVRWSGRCPTSPRQSWRNCGPRSRACPPATPPSAARRRGPRQDPPAPPPRDPRPPQRRPSRPNRQVKHQIASSSPAARGPPRPRRPRRALPRPRRRRPTPGNSAGRRTVSEAVLLTIQAQQQQVDDGRCQRLGRQTRRLTFLLAGCHMLH